MAIKRTTKVDSSFSMSSMTDIVFLLLIFFLVTSTLINPNALKLLLPKSTGQVSAKATVSVSIKHWQQTDDFSFHINGDETPVRFDQVEDELINLLQSEDDPTRINKIERGYYNIVGKLSELGADIQKKSGRQDEQLTATM